MAEKKEVVLHLNIDTYEKAGALSDNNPEDFLERQLEFDINEMPRKQNKNRDHLTDEQVIEDKREINEMCLDEFINIIKRHEADLETAFRVIETLNKRLEKLE